MAGGAGGGAHRLDGAECFALSGECITRFPEFSIFNSFVFNGMARPLAAGPFLFFSEGVDMSICDAQMNDAAAVVRQPYSQGIVGLSH